jgi:hypothetical protein
MSDQETINPFSGLALKLQRDPRFMAYVLAAYQRQESLSDEELAEALGTLPELITRLALCRRPAASAPQFAEQVRELADYTLTDEAQLAGILRQVDGLKRLAALPAAVPEGEAQVGLSLSGVLAAARDREEESDEPQQADAPSAVEDSGAGE